MKVAIVGMSPSCEVAPWSDPQWQKWGMPWHGEKWACMDRLFEMHDISELREIHSADYFARLRDCGVPLYMQGQYEGFGAQRYPIEAVTQTVGRDYMTSSVAYMIALAIHEGAEEIALYGVDINENQYGYQRPCIEYLLGVAVGRGIKVTTQPESALFTFEGSGYAGRYGYLG